MCRFSPLLFFLFFLFELFPCNRTELVGDLDEASDTALG